MLAALTAAGPLGNLGTVAWLADLDGKTREAYERLHARRAFVYRAGRAYPGPPRSVLALFVVLFRLEFGLYVDTLGTGPALYLHVARAPKEGGPIWQLHEVQLARRAALRPHRLQRLLTGWPMGCTRVRGR